MGIKLAGMRICQTGREAERFRSHFDSGNKHSHKLKGRLTGKKWCIVSFPGIDNMQWNALVRDNTFDTACYWDPDCTDNSWRTTWCKQVHRAKQLNGNAELIACQKQSGGWGHQQLWELKWCQSKGYKVRCTSFWFDDVAFPDLSWLDLDTY